ERYGGRVADSQVEKLNPTHQHPGVIEKRSLDGWPALDGKIMADSVDGPDPQTSCGDHASRTREKHEIVDGLAFLAEAPSTQAQIDAVESHRAQVVGGRQKKLPAWLQNAAQFLHRLPWMGNMLDCFARNNSVETLTLVSDRLESHPFPSDRRQAVFGGELAAFLHGGEREIGGDNLAWRRALPGHPAGETTSAAADLQHPLACQVLSPHVFPD